MPTYDYTCKNCGLHSEILQKISDEALKDCPSCQKPSLERGFGGGLGLNFEGSGYYLTDYASPCEQGCKS